MLQTTTHTTPRIAIERPLPNSKLEEAFYKVVKDYNDVITFRRLKANGNIASATALVTRVVINETLYPLLEVEHEYKAIVAEENGPSIYDFPEMLKK